MVEIGSAKLLSGIGFMLMVGGLLLVYYISRNCGAKRLVLLSLFALASVGLLIFDFYSFPLIRAQYIGKPLTINDLKEDQEYEAIISFSGHTRVGFEKRNNFEVRDVIGLPRMPSGMKFYIHDGKVRQGVPHPKLVPQISI